MKATKFICGFFVLSRIFVIPEESKQFRTKIYFKFK